MDTQLHKERIGDKLLSTDPFFVYIQFRMLGYPVASQRRKGSERDEKSRNNYSNLCFRVRNSFCCEKEIGSVSVNTKQADITAGRAGQGDPLPACFHTVL